MNPTLPGRALPDANVALRPVIGLMTPRQFEPTMRMAPRRASSRIRRSSAAPASPVSLKPAEMTIAPFDTKAARR
jgi:hypothetical protein